MPTNWYIYTAHGVVLKKSEPPHPHLWLLRGRSNHSIVVRDDPTQPPEQGSKPQYELALDRGLRIIVSDDGGFEPSIKLGIPPEDIAKIMMDEAILALMAERLSLPDIQATFKKYAKRDLPRFYTRLKDLASDQTAPRAE
jgi:hypothetical protein